MIEQISFAGIDCKLQKDIQTLLQDKVNLEVT